TVEAEITFEDGFTACARASRVAQGRERTLRLIWPEGDLTIDFLANTFENNTPFAFDAGFAAGPAARDRLGASLARFIAAVRGDAPAPMASAADGLRALDLALAVEQAVGG
ncbi:MAG TPA: gfo/Idh/MocA family oxidoreductase, partial [Caulobacteraceae bacterium]|nr:gfo/Idh/MocA family oxidoreductase [Caulobacteraceae bacterium]